MSERLNQEEHPYAEKIAQQRKLLENLESQETTPSNKTSEPSKPPISRVAQEAKAKMEAKIYGRDPVFDSGDEQRNNRKKVIKEANSRTRAAKSQTDRNAGMHRSRIQ